MGGLFITNAKDAFKESGTLTGTCTLFIGGVETPETMLLKLPVTPVGKPLTLRVVEAGTSPPTFVSVTLSVVVAAEAIVRVELPSVSNWPGA